MSPVAHPSQLPVPAFVKPRSVQARVPIAQGSCWDVHQHVQLGFAGHTCPHAHRSKPLQVVDHALAGCNRESARSNVYNIEKAQQRPPCLHQKSAAFTKAMVILLHRPQNPRQHSLALTRFHLEGPCGFCSPAFLGQGLPKA